MPKEMTKCFIASINFGLGCPWVLLSPKKRTSGKHQNEISVMKYNEALKEHPPAWHCTAHTLLLKYNWSILNSSHLNTRTQVPLRLNTKWFQTCWGNAVWPFGSFPTVIEMAARALKVIRNRVRRGTCLLARRFIQGKEIIISISINEPWLSVMDSHKVMQIRGHRSIIKCVPRLTACLE